MMYLQPNGVLHSFVDAVGLVLNFFRFEVGEPEPFIYDRSDGQWAADAGNHHIPHVT